MALESLDSSSTRFVPARQLPAVNKASHHTIGKGSSQTHQEVFRVLIESKNILPFARNKKAPEAQGKIPKASGAAVIVYRTGARLYLLFISLKSARSIPPLLRPADR